MELGKYKQNITNISRQRNLFLCLLIATIICCLILSIRVATDNRQVILVPGITREMSYTNSGVSSGVLEEMTTMLLPMLVDLDSDSIDWKKNKVLEYMSEMDDKYAQKIIDYYNDIRDNYATLKLSTRFGIKKYRINSKDLIVMASGILKSHFGLEGYETRNVSYLLKYEYVGGRLLLKEFKLIDEEKVKEIERKEQ